MAVWKRDPRNLLALCKIYDREAIGVGELDENAFRRAVRIGLDRHRPHAFVELMLPGDRVSRKVDDGQEFPRDRARD